MTDSFNNSLTSEKIVKDFESKRITEIEAGNLLKVLIESSKDPRTRLRCIELLGTLNFSNDGVFKLLESCLLSDENYSVKEAAARVLCEKFPTQCLAPLKWVVENERTSEILRIIYNLSDNFRNPHFSALLEKKISELYGVIPRELPFLFDQKILLNEVDVACRWRQEYSLLQYRKFDPLNYQFHYHLGYYASEPKYTVLNRRIIGLCIPKSIKIPVSIKRLSKLKYLSIDKLDSLPCSLTTFKRLKGLNVREHNRLPLPKDLINLKSLRELWLSPSFFRPISKSLLSLIEQNVASKYVRQGVHPDDAVGLGLLEAYVGRKIESELIYWMSKERFADYGLNNQGRVISIHLDYQEKDLGLEFFSIPEPIFRFDALEKLIIRNNDVFYISPKLKRLKNLRELDLGFNPLETIPKFITKLKNLEKLHLEHTKINTIPDFVKNLKNLESLELCMTRIREFPEFIFQLPKLKYIGLSGTKIPESVMLKKLEQIKANFEDFSL